MTVRSLTPSYTADWRTTFPDNFWLPFYQRTTIWSPVLVYCTSIGATVRRGILLIYLDFDTEDTCTEAAHDWLFMVNLKGMRGSSLVFTNMYLVTLLDDTLKEFHAYTIIEFMWWGKNLFHHILHHPHRLHLIVMRLRFRLWAIIIGLVVERVTCFQDEGLDVLVIHMYKCAVIKVSVISIKYIFLFLTWEAPHTLDNWVTDLSNLYLSI